MPVTGAPSPVGGVDLGGVAPVSFSVTGAPASVDSDIVVEWDFDNDGDFDQPVENITGYVISAETLSGRDYPSSLIGKAGPGQLRLTLLNDSGRFSYFNTSSPVATGSFSLKTGRKIRVRTTESVPVDPTLLARDRFRTDGILTATETGQTWVAQVDGFEVIGGVARAKGVFSTRLFHTIDVNTDDYYAQCTLRQLPPSNARQSGLVVRWTDANNYTLVRYTSHETAPGLVVLNRDAGVDTTLATYPVRGWEGMTIGVAVTGSALTAYVSGVPVASVSVTGNPTGDQCGLHASFSDFTGRHPEIGDFYVWDRVPAEVNGILWTGAITDVTPDVTVGQHTFAHVTAEGVLADAARSKTASPRLPYRGEPTGLVVGDILARAGLLHPPGPIQAGIVTGGPVGIDDGDALSLARDFEEIERGFLHETNEGYIGYDALTARTGALSQAWFTDTPGSGQFPYSAISPVDHKGQIINEVVAGVAADAPSIPVVTNANGITDVTITMPTVEAGDLLVIFIASSFMTAGEQWLIPIWWVSHRDVGSDYGMRVYSHFCDGTETGTTVKFYDNVGGSAGLWTAQIYRIPNWYESYNNGVAMSDVVRGGNPAALVHGWGRAPTLFIVARTGLGASPSAMTFSASTDPPDGYTVVTGSTSSSGVIALDVGIASTYKIDCTESEDPTTLSGLTNAITDESVVFAVRGYNGPHTKATLENPRTTGGDGRFVTERDLDSQDEHNVIRTHQAPALFANTGDATDYVEAVLGEFADDRPIFSLSFWATSSAQQREQAVTRRVGDKVTVTATGDTSLGVEGDFFIESINHRITNGAKLWEVTWQLSPA